MDASTTGSAQQHKIKTINVEVNLLDAWAIQRVELESKVFRKLLLLGGIILSGFVVIPLLASVGAEKAGSLKGAESSLAFSVREKNELEVRAKAAAPGIERDDVINRSHQYSASFLDELAKIFNSAPSQMFFDQMQAEVTGGECTIKVVANAGNPDIGRNFIAEASKGSNVLSSTQTSVKQSQLGENSVKFDYIKKVGLAP